MMFLMGYSFAEEHVLNKRSAISLISNPLHRIVMLENLYNLNRRSRSCQRDRKDSFLSVPAFHAGGLLALAALARIMLCCEKKLLSIRRSLNLSSFS
jgi:hypothetical protein